ncbi:MAG TPA: hypothetical protein VE861_16265 [Gemmatimonadaceae bacterium]|nr:hypothetical protein [Gemmatimonadaceae bacterium]
MIRDFLPAALRDRYDAARSIKRDIDGVAVWFLNERADIDDAQLQGRLAEALALIAKYMPHNCRRLRTDVSCIWVKRWPNRGVFFHDSRIMVIDTTFVVNPTFTRAQVAATILHEGVHARVTAMRVNRRLVTAADEERLCRRAEIAFGELAPGGAPVVARAMEILGLSDDEVAPGIDVAVAEERLRQLRKTEGGSGTQSG